MTRGEALLLLKSFFRCCLQDRSRQFSRSKCDVCRYLEARENLKSTKRAFKLVVEAPFPSLSVTLLQDHNSVVGTEGRPRESNVILGLVSGFPPRSSLQPKKVTQSRPKSRALMFWKRKGRAQSRSKMATRGEALLLLKLFFQNLKTPTNKIYEENLSMWFAGSPPLE